MKLFVQSDGLTYTRNYIFQTPEINTFSYSTKFYNLRYCTVLNEMFHPKLCIMGSMFISSFTLDLRSKVKK